MKVLSVNAGSSSFKFEQFNSEIWGRTEKWFWKKVCISSTEFLLCNTELYLIFEKYFGLV